MAARKRKTSKPKEVTISELQSYVQGAIDLNADGWHPDKDQWEKIVAMLMSVKNDPPPVQQVPVAAAPVAAPVAAQPAPVSTMTGEPVRAAGRPAKLDMRAGSPYTSERIGAPESQGTVGNTPVTKSGIKVKTPDIDSPVYDTPFE